MRDIYIRQ